MKFDPEGDTAVSEPMSSQQRVFELSGARCYRMGGRVILEIPDAVVLEMARQPLASLTGLIGNTEILDEEKFLEAVLQQFRATEIQTARGRFESPMSAGIRGAIRAVLEQGATAAWRRETP